MPAARRRSGLMVPSLPSGDRTLSLLSKQAALSGSHFQATHTRSFNSPSPSVPARGRTTSEIQSSVLRGVGPWLLGCQPAARKLLRKKIRRKHSTEACCPWSEKQPWVVHTLPDGWVCELLVGLLAVFCLHVQINLVEEYLGQKYFDFTPTYFTFHLLFRHKGEKKSCIFIFIYIRYIF